MLLVCTVQCYFSALPRIITAHCSVLLECTVQNYQITLFSVIGLIVSGIVKSTLSSITRTYWLVHSLAACSISQKKCRIILASVERDKPILCKSTLRKQALMILLNIGGTSSFKRSYSCTNHYKDIPQITDQKTHL